MDLCSIKDPSFLQSLSNTELEELSSEIRSFLIEKVSKTGGHIGGNLGVVELTIALHKYFPGYKLIFDVGHQCYTHKILTGRAKYFDSLRQQNGLSGFPLRSESEYDSWEIGHSSTSLSALAGFITNDIPSIAIIGDGALTGGEAMEALEYLLSLNKKCLIIINDNSFSISKNVGLIRKCLDSLRSTRGYIALSNKNRTNNFLKKIKNDIKHLFYKSNVFDDLGFKYYGPIDGHNFSELFKYFKYVDSQNRPTILHVVTKKGKGYKYAENDLIGKWHCVPPFDIETGESKKGNKDFIPYSKAVADYCKAKYDSNNNFKVVVPAMTVSSNMVELKDYIGKNYIDTGITEQFAMSVSAALSMNSETLVCIYSSFMQRAYDQIHQDVSLQNVPLVIVVDKSGIISGNGKTHQGLYDISYLNTIPHIEVVAPKDMVELYELLDYAFKIKKPICIHIPNDSFKFVDNLKINNSNIEKKWVAENNIKNPKGYLITYSNLVNYIKDEMKDIDVEVINARFIKPMDLEMLDSLLQQDKPVFIYEEAIGENGLYSSITNHINEKSINKHVYSLSFPLDYIDLGSVEEIRKEYQLDKNSIKEKVKSIIN